MRKELLTIDKCKTDIASHHKRSVTVLSLVICFFAVVLFMSWLEYGTTPIFYLMIAFTLIFIVGAVLYVLKNRRSEWEDTFFLTCDVLSDKKMIKLGKRGDGFYVYALVFSRHATYEIPPLSYRWQKKKISAEKLYSTCEAGDEFYLILKKGDKGEIVAVYSKRYFELSGELSAKVVK